MTRCEIDRTGLLHHSQGSITSLSILQTSDHSGMDPSTSPLLNAISKFMVVVCVMGVMMMAASQYNLSYNWLQPERIRHSSPHSNRTKWSSKHNDGVLRYFDSPVHVVQVGDDSYANLMYNHTLRNKQWAKCMDYEYKFISLDKEEIVSDNMPCVLTLKVKHIRRALRSITKGDWMFFLDLDVQFASTTCTALDAILPTMSLKKSQPCVVPHNQYWCCHHAVDECDIAAYG